ncbi:MAG: RNA polymerase sigma factor [Flammeovirgaceae bacterium]
MLLEDFKKMVLPFQNKLYRFALRLLGTRAEAEDVVQEVFIKAWDRREQLLDYQNVEAWCMKVTKHMSLDVLKSKHRKFQQNKSDQDVTNQALTPDRQAEVADAYAYVHQIIESLPEKQKLVIQLRDVEGYSYQEIADMMEISLSQVKVNLFRARDKVRKQLQKAESYGL